MSENRGKWGNNIRMVKKIGNSLDKFKKVKPFFGKYSLRIKKSNQKTKLG